MNDPRQPVGRRAQLTVFLTILLDLIGFGMILPLLPFYAQRFHATPVQIGLLFTSYSLTQLLFAPLLGRLSDRVGRRPVLLASITGSVAAYLLFAFAPSYAVLLLARSLSGLAAANYAIAQAYMADVSAPEERSKAMGLVGAAFGLGFVLGPALGGILAHLGPRAVPLTAAMFSGANLLVAFFGLPESLSPEVRGRAVRGSWLGWSDLRIVWRDSPLRGLMLLFFLVMFCFSMMEATLALFCQQRFGFGVRQTSWLFVFVGVILVIVQGGLLGRLVKRYGERSLILSGIVLMAVGLAILPLSHLWVLLVSLGLLAVGQGVHNPSSLGLLSRLTDESSQGSTIGLSRSFGALARALGPAAGTFLFAAAGAAWPFWAAGGLMVVALFIALGVLRQVTIV
ncbi:MAG: transporter, family, tetracycline resistance protein [Acidobacteriota bacterium]|nr:transporter, family, tetracycline resistance protein [Acidobacteriota bacterium]